MIVTQSEKLKYLEEMIQPYEKPRSKDQIKKYFIEQYLHGAGNELAGKFWELRSSARMAYDLYSWMKDSDEILDFQFEFQLPNLGSGGIGPNMDVFIETEDELLFIESKFTERANLHYIDNGYLKEAYYIPKPYGRCQMSLKKRFHDNEWATQFSEFCYDWERQMNDNRWHQGHDWFEPKQETCHLSGILLYLYNKKFQDRIRDKKIRLLNIYWELPKDVKSVMANAFCTSAQRLIGKIISSNNPGITEFKIDAFSVQEMLETPNKLSPLIVFPEGILEKMTNRNESILLSEGIKTR